MLLTASEDPAEKVRRLRLQKEKLEGLCRALQEQLKVKGADASASAAAAATVVISAEAGDAPAAVGPAAAPSAVGPEEEIPAPAVAGGDVEGSEEAS